MQGQPHKQFRMFKVHLIKFLVSAFLLPFSLLLFFFLLLFQLFLTFFKGNGVLIINILFLLTFNSAMVNFLSFSDVANMRVRDCNICCKIIWTSCLLTYCYYILSYQYFYGNVTQIFLLNLYIMP